MSTANRTYFDSGDRGVIFDGTAGQTYNDVRLIRLAAEHGFAIGTGLGQGEPSDLSQITEEDLVAMGPDYYGHSADLAAEALDWLNDYAVDGQVRLEWVDGNLMCVGPEMTQWEAEQAYDEMLDDCYGTVSIAGMDYDTGRALREVDPIAYRCGMLDWADGEGIEIV